MVLRLCDKYQLDAIHNRIVEVVKSDWPSNEDPFYNDIDSPSPIFRDTIADPFSSIVLAKMCNVPEILPAIYYYMCISERETAKGVDSGRAKVDWSVVEASVYKRFLRCCKTFEE